MDAGAWRNLIDPLGLLNQKHSPSTSDRHAPSGSAARRPPLLPLPEHDGAVSACLYGTPGRFDALPFPNMEWWWNTIEVDDSHGNRYFMLTNVHSFGTFVGGPSTCATIALFDTRSGARRVVRSTGKVSGDRSCTYVAPGWLLQRLDPCAPSFRSDLQRAASLLDVSPAELARASERGCYIVSVQSRELEAQVYLEQHATVLYGDRTTEPGWYDNNPSGLLPHWASYRSRFETPRGRLRLSTPQGGTKFQVADGNARFDHQSVHWSTRDNGPPSLAALAEQLGSRPKWIWYHGRLGGRLNVMAYKIWNVNTNVTTKVAAAVVDEVTGELGIADPKSILFSASRTTGPLAAPTGGTLTFNLTGGCGAVPAGSYELRFDYDSSIDWSVNYAVGRFLVYRAQEAYCTVSGRTPCGPAQGTGTQEVLDLGKLGLA